MIHGLRCEDCKYVLIHYDKKGNRTLRCYYDYLKSLKDVTKFERFKDVTNKNVTNCEHYIHDMHPIEHRTYRAKEIKNEGTT